MSGSRPPASGDSGGNEISILLVDDDGAIRESIKKMLGFEPDFKVVGTATTGREGVKSARELEPDIIVMDINMPDMDGLEATDLIQKHVPKSAVIIMSVQNDADYMQRAMLAGAKYFLTKPVDIDALYNTIRTVYRNHEAIRMRYEQMESTVREEMLRPTDDEGGAVGDRLGHIIAVYSPQGGVGKTTISSSIASALMAEDVKVLLVDAALQFPDVGKFLNLKGQTSLVDLVEDIDDIDVELFENVVMSHDSGLKVLLGPARPEIADEVLSVPGAVGEILEQIRWHYDFIVVDTATVLNDNLLPILDRASLILLVGTPTLVSAQNVRFVLDLFDQLEYDPNKTCLVLNRVWDDKNHKVTLSSDRIEKFLKRKVVGSIPAVDERHLLRAINNGVPIIASDRNQDKPPIKQLLLLAEAAKRMLLGEEEEDEASEEKKTEKKSRWGW